MRTFALSRLRSALVSTAVLAGLSGVALAQPSTSQDQSPLVVVRPPPSQTLSLSIGMSRTITVNRAFKTIHITNPAIVDILPISDKSAILVPKSLGATNIDILDKDSDQISSVNIFVDQPGTGRIEVHNKSLLGSATVFRCGGTGCNYIEELTVKEPAPLPKGHTVTEQRNEVTTTTNTAEPHN